MAERVAIVVVGMHRSGSSAMARVLSLAGAALPRLLMPAGDGNETGHWEPVRVADYNDKVLAAFDATWDSPFGLGMNAVRRAALDPFVDGARDIIREEYGDSPLIVLKEPRISLVADLWIKALEAEGFRCKFVITVRSPTEVAASLRKRNGFALDKGLLLWGAYQASSEVLTRSYDRIFCRYDDVLVRPASVLDEIEAKLRIELPRRTAQSHAEMDAFVQPAWKRNDASAIPPIPDHLKPIGELSEYIYASIIGETPNIDVSRDLQNWFADLDQTITPLMIGIEQRLQAEVVSVQGQVDAYRTEIERINALYGEQLADVARLNAQYAEIEGVRVETEQRFTAAEQARQVAQAQLEAREAELANLLGTLNTTNGALSELSATLDGRTAELAQAGAECAATTAHLEALSNTNAQLEADLVATRTALTAQSAETAALQAAVAEYAATTAHLEALSNINAQLETDLAATRTALTAQSAETAALQAAVAECAATTAHLEALSNTNAQLEADLAATRAALTAQSAETATLQADLTEIAAQQARVEGELAESRGREAALVASADLLAATMAQATSEHAVASNAMEARHEEECASLLLAAHERETALQVALNASQAAQAELAERLEQTAAEADADRAAAIARESVLIAEAAAWRDAAALADQASAASRVALTQAQDSAAVREADLVAQIDALHANMRAADERNVAAEQAIAAVNARNEDLTRLHAEEIGAATASGDQRLAALQGALDQAVTERDRLLAELHDAAAERVQLQAELDQLRATEARSAQSTVALQEVVAERDAALVEHAGQIATLTQSVAELDHARTVQTETFAEEAQKARDREDGLNAALRTEMTLREDDYVERQSLASRMRAVFVAPRRRSTGTDPV